MQIKITLQPIGHYSQNTNHKNISTEHNISSLECVEMKFDGQLSPQRSEA